MDYLTVYLVGFFLNIPFGYFRRNFKKMSFMWWLMIHAPIPVVIVLRKFFDIPLSVAYFIPALLICVSGQMVGSRILPRFLKTKEIKENK